MTERDWDGHMEGLVVIESKEFVCLKRIVETTLESTRKISTLSE